MNDILSIARRLEEYASEPGISEQKREDLLTARDGLRAFHIVLNAVEQDRPHRIPPIPG